ncbi:MAG: DUF6880 family protein [Candidatus Nitrotoga sp.]
MTQNAYLHLENDTLSVDVEREKKLQVPLHHLGSVVCLGNIMLSPALMHRCADGGISLVLLNNQGRFKARLEGLLSGNILLRQAQHLISTFNNLALAIRSIKMLHELLSKDIKKLAGAAYYARGKGYFEQGLVRSLDENDDEITAYVEGTYEYEVRLWEENNELCYECSCPVGQDYEFCKHCVAVGLAVLAQDVPENQNASKKKPSSTNDIRNYLETLEPETLMGIITDACKHDKRLRERLLLAARGRGNANAAIKAWKDALNRAMVTRGYVDYREMRSFAAGIQEVIDALAAWIPGGRAAQAVDLAEYAADKVEKLIEECDDSNGELSDLLESIGELHLAACKKARPDPAELAGRLLNYELHGDLDTFFHAVERYADVLGEQGIAEYRRLAEMEWKKIPALPPGDKGAWDGSRYRITNVMEALAKQSGNLEELVAVKSRNLTKELRFLNIAEIYRNAKNRDKALEWAERGLAAFPVKTDVCLRDFLIEEYLHRGLGEKAIVLSWAQFEENPYLESYIKLNKITYELNDWPVWRDKALAHVRNRIAQTYSERSKLRYGKAEAPDQSPLVEILLWEKDAEAAWQEAKAGICHERLWLQLADVRAKEHPEDAIAVYQRQVAHLVLQTNNQSYAEAITLVKKIKPLLARCRGASSVGDYFAELRVTFKAKRNFMKMLDQLR